MLGVPDCSCASLDEGSSFPAPVPLMLHFLRAPTAVPRDVQQAVPQEAEVPGPEEMHPGHRRQRRRS